MYNSNFSTYCQNSTQTMKLKSDTVWQDIIKSEIIFFIKILWVKLTNGNETKSDIFLWDIFKSDIIFHCLQNTKIFQRLS